MIANTNIMHVGKSFIKAVFKVKVQNNKEGDLTWFENSLLLVKVYCWDGTEDKEPGSEPQMTMDEKRGAAKKDPDTSSSYCHPMMKKRLTAISKEFIETVILCDTYY